MVTDLLLRSVLPLFKVAVKVTGEPMAGAVVGDAERVVVVA